jgi:hypothetical protein
MLDLNTGLFGLGVKGSGDWDLLWELRREGKRREEKLLGLFGILFLRFKEENGVRAGRGWGWWWWALYYSYIIIVCVRRVIERWNLNFQDRKKWKESK